MMVRHLSDLAEAICNGWTGMSVKEACSHPDAPRSRWNTGMCSGVRPARTLKGDDGVVYGWLDFFTGVMAADDSGKQGVLVRLEDSGGYGSIAVRVRTVGREHGMCYTDRFYPTAPMDEMVNKIRTLVEIACQDLTREWVQNRTAIRAIWSFSPEEAEALWNAQP